MLSLLSLNLFPMIRFHVILCFVLACLSWLSSAYAAVVPGTPRDAFLRAHPLRVTAPEGITYQVPDDKLEPDKLYHDASKDGSRLVTRKRVVGILRQSVEHERLLDDYGGYLEYDVTFSYESTREKKGEGKLKWTHNKAPEPYVNKQRLRKKADKLKEAFHVDAYPYMLDRVSAHETQHVNDAVMNPVWLYGVSNVVGNKQNLMNKSDRDMLEQLNPSLLETIEDQHKKLILFAEGRAVYAEVCCAANQLIPLLELKDNAVSEEQKKQYVPYLYEMLFLHKDETEDVYEDRMPKATYGYYINERLNTKKDVFRLAQNNVMLGSLEKVKIGGEDSDKSYKCAYEDYMQRSDAVPLFEAWSGKLQNPTDKTMLESVMDYQKNINEMYRLIHAKLYEENIYLECINDTNQMTPKETTTTRSLDIKIDNLYEWLVCAEDALEALSEACSKTSVKNRYDAEVFVMKCRRKAEADDQVDDNAAKMVRYVLGLRMMVAPGIVVYHIKDSSMRSKCMEKRADVAKKFVSLLDENFGDNALIELLACMLVEGSPVGLDYYTRKKRSAIISYQVDVPKSHDNPDMRNEYKWNVYKKQIIKKLKEEYMEQINAFREEAGM